MTDLRPSRPPLVDAILDPLDALMYEYATADDLIVQVMDRLREVRLAFDAGVSRSKPQRTATVPQPETVGKDRQPPERPLVADDEFAVAFANVFHEQMHSLFALDFEADSVTVNAVAGEIMASPDFTELLTEYVRRHLPRWRYGAL